jgi:hypothetical protein
MGRVFGKFFRGLIEGDPVALTVAGIFAVIIAAALLVWWKIARDLRREDEERQRRYGGKK